METIKKTSEYTIYQKRSKRYGVRGSDLKWINGDKKVEILLKEKLLDIPASGLLFHKDGVDIPAPKPKEAAPAEPEAATDSPEKEAAPAEEAAAE